MRLGAAVLGACLAVGAAMASPDTYPLDKVKRGQTGYGTYIKYENNLGGNPPLKILWKGTRRFSINTA